MTAPRQLLFVAMVGLVGVIAAARFARAEGGGGGNAEVINPQVHVSDDPKPKGQAPQARRHDRRRPEVAARQVLDLDDGQPAEGHDEGRQAARRTSKAPRRSRSRS